MKECCKCKSKKLLLEFNKNRCKEDGLQQICKVCQKYYRELNKENNSRYQAKYRKENDIKLKEYFKKYAQDNKEAKSAYKKEYRKNNKSIVAKGIKKWKKENSHRVTASSMKRKASKLQRTPKWLSIYQLEEIQFFYWFSKFCEKELEVKCQVDHIIPLQGKTVSGLHVPWNLQVLTAYDNNSKGIKHV